MRTQRRLRWDARAPKPPAGIPAGGNGDGLALKMLQECPAKAFFTNHQHQTALFGRRAMHSTREPPSDPASRLGAKGAHYVSAPAQPMSPSQFFGGPAGAQPPAPMPAVELMHIDAQRFVSARRPARRRDANSGGPAGPPGPLGLAIA